MGRTKKAASPVAEKASATIVAKGKRGASAAPEVVVAPKGRKTTAVASSAVSESFLASIVREIRESLLAKANAQVQEAKGREWSYDPRPPVDETVYFRQLVNRIAPKDASFRQIIDALASKLATESEDSDLVQEFLENVNQDVSGGDVQFSDEQFQTIAAHRLLDILPVNDLFEYWNSAGISYDAATTNAHAVKLISKDLSLSGLFQKFPLLSKSAFAVEKVPPVEDVFPRKEDYHCFDEFYDDMLWLFGVLDSFKCTTYGRIKTAVYDSEKMRSVIDPDSLVEGFKEHIQQKYVGKNLTDLSEEALHQLCVYDILNARLDPRTYFYEYVYNIRESDYTGSRSGIAEWAAEQAEEFSNPSKFLQCLALGMTFEKAEEHVEWPGTSSFYVPGMKEPWDIFGDDENEEGLKSGTAVLHYLTCNEGTSNKFYEIEIDYDSNTVNTRYGRVGTDGVRATKSFSSMDEATAFIEKTLKEKQKKGYEADTENTMTVEEENPGIRAKEESSKGGTAVLHYLTCNEGTSNKFYEIEIDYDSNTVNTRYGRVGTDGVRATKSFSSMDEATAFIEKTLKEKQKKGYE